MVSVHVSLELKGAKKFSLKKQWGQWESLCTGVEWKGTHWKSRRFVSYLGVFLIKTIIPLALFGYKMIIANSALPTLLSISNARFWNNNYCSIHIYIFDWSFSLLFSFVQHNWCVALIRWNDRMWGTISMLFEMHALQLPINTPPFYKKHLMRINLFSLNPLMSG